MISCVENRINVFESTGELILTEYRLTDEVHIRLTTFLMSVMAWGGIDFDDGYFAFIDHDDYSVLFDIKRDENLLIGRGAVPLTSSLKDRCLSHNERLERAKRVVDSIEKVYARARYDYDVLTSIGFAPGVVHLPYGEQQCALTLNIDGHWSISTNILTTLVRYDRLIVAIRQISRFANKKKVANLLDKGMLSLTIDSLNSMAVDNTPIREHIPVVLLDMMIKGDPL